MRKFVLLRLAELIEKSIPQIRPEPLQTFPFDFKSERMAPSSTTDRSGAEREGFLWAFSLRYSHSLKVTK